MRWIDIDLATPARRAAADPLLTEAAARAAVLTSLQEQAGLDAPAVADAMAAVGGLLFRAVTASDPGAFSPDRERPGATDPALGEAAVDGLRGYHVVADSDALGLPWTWLHNGLGFVLERHAICAGPAPTWAAAPSSGPAWLARHREAVLGELAHGATPLPRLLDALRPAEVGAARILFLAGHGDAEVWPLLYREAEAIDGALAGSPLPRPLARLDVPARAVPPAALARARWSWQGFHFAGPTARPPAVPAEEPWLALRQAGWQAAPGADADGPAVLPLESVGELEYAGVDPISALLDEVAARADAGVAAAAATPGAGQAGAGVVPSRGVPPGGAWLLEDGPFRPEALAPRRAAPPLVFSNSWLSLPALGPRFLAAGASTFVGPLLGLRSEPARAFAARFYDRLAAGWPAAAAARAAALALRERLGPTHPAWLGYGVVGRGNLALQYL